MQFSLARCWLFTPQPEQNDLIVDSCWKSGFVIKRFEFGTAINITRVLVLSLAKLFFVALSQPRLISSISHHNFAESTQTAQWTIILYVLLDRSLMPVLSSYACSCHPFRINCNKSIIYRKQMWQGIPQLNCKFYRVARFCYLSPEPIGLTRDRRLFAQHPQCKYFHCNYSVSESKIFALSYESERKQIFVRSKDAKLWALRLKLTETQSHKSLLSIPPSQNS